MVRHVEPCEAGFEDRERRVVDVVRIEGAVDCKPSRSLEQTVGDIVKSYAQPCGNHG